MGRAASVTLVAAALEEEMAPASEARGSGWAGFRGTAVAASAEG